MDLISELYKPFHGQLVEGFQLITDEWSKLKQIQDFEQLSRRAIIWPVDLVYGGGVAFTSDGGPTARATSNKPVEATDSWKHVTGRFDVSYDTMNDNDAKQRRSQIVRQLKYQTKDKLKSMKKRMSYAFYGFSDNILFNIDGVASAPEYEVNDRYGVAGLAVDFTAIVEGKDMVAVIDADDGTTVLGIELVTGIDRDAGTITLAGSVSGAADGDHVVLANQIDGTSTDLDMGINGLLEITDGGQPLHGIDPADFPDWNPAVDEDLSGALSGTEFYKAFKRSSQESGYKTTFLWSTIEAIANAGGAQLDQRRYGREDDTMVLGFEDLVSMGVDIEGKINCPAGHAFGGSFRALKKISPDEDIETVKTGGPQQFVFKGDELGYFRNEVFRCQLTCKSRKGMIHYSGVAEA